MRVRDVRLLTSNWYVTRVTTFDFQHGDGTWSTQERETYDRGDGATHPALRPGDAHASCSPASSAIPAYVNGHPDGDLIEVVGGLLDDDDAETAIRREAEEESGVRVGAVEHVFDVVHEPGLGHREAALLRRALRRATARCRRRARRRGRGHHGARGAFDEALARIGDDIIDAKTIMLLQWAALRGPFAR